MAGRVLLVLALLEGAVAVLFWRPARPPPQDVPRKPTAADLVIALEEGDSSVLPRLLALKQEGIAALEQRLPASGRGILELVPRKDDPRDRLIAALEAFGPAAEPALVRVLKALPEKAPAIAAALEAIGAKLNYSPGID